MEWFRRKLSIALADVPLALWKMWPARIFSRLPYPWALITNRAQSVDIDPNTGGVSCNWQGTSDLVITEYALVGKLILRKAVAAFPFILSDRPTVQSRNIDVSFIVGHRGNERIANLLMVLESIAGQQGVAVECIVVEHSEVKEAKYKLPAWVKYIHLPADTGSGYSRSAAFNAGARIADGKMLILHDNDLLVPSVYAAQHFEVMNQGFDVLSLKRFIFYLSSRESAQLRKARSHLEKLQTCEVIKQNATGGGSIAIDRSTYFQSGGFDEDFVGWGGEDDEFWSRACQYRIYKYGYLPLIHVWHEPQQEKRGKRGNENSELLQKKLSFSPLVRIANLKAANFPDA
jgi:hypothetical protein